MYEEWLSKSEEATEVVSLTPIQKLAATLDNKDTFRNGDVLCPGWQWLFFTPTVPLRETDKDGHAVKGGFLPPIDMPRRMWAGGRIDYLHPIRIGQPVHKKSSIATITEKEGKSGKLIFVLVRHEYTTDEGLALVEEQDIVYREAPKPGQLAATAIPAPAEAMWSKEITPHPVLLFRYSALTFNSHRIHYDLKYAQEVEGYPGLVVHGPLIATLLLELLRENVPGEAISQFSFRAVSPLFDTHPFTVHGSIQNNEVKLWALNPEQQLAMEAQASLQR